MKNCDQFRELIEAYASGRSTPKNAPRSKRTSQPAAPTAPRPSNKPAGSSANSPTRLQKRPRQTCARFLEETKID